MSYVDKNLMNGERVIYRAKLHWMIFITPIALISGGVYGVIYTSGMQNEQPITIILMISALSVCVGVIKLINAIITKICTELSITNKRIIAKFGFIRRKTIELNHLKVESLGVDQGIVDRLIGAGTITIQGTGGGKTPIPNIDDPLVFRREAMQAFDNPSSI